jgi:hypothetical protein
VKLKIDGRAMIKNESFTGGTDIDNETIEIEEGDVLVSDGPVGIEIILDDE